MKDLTLSNVKTSSKDIAEWTGKKHDAVVKDIRVILNDLYSEDASSQTHDTKKSKLLFNIKDLDGQVHEHKDNRNYTAFFELDDDHVNTLLTGYSTKARMAVNRELRLRREADAKPMTQMEIVVASAQALLDVERKQLALEQAQKALADKTNAIEERLDNMDGDTGYMTVLAYCRKNDLSCSKSEANSMGRKAGTACRSLGVKTGKVPDERWGEVNSYPIGILDKVAEAMGL